MKPQFTFVLFFFLVAAVRGEPIPEFKWRAVEIDRIEIGYGLQMADVNGDRKTDIVLADKNTIQWYENPDWTKHVI
ncbi:MAG: VCBS repeat-containing protein, partial [Pirellulales bacterium]